jgi:hypothetical protein
VVKNRKSFTCGKNKKIRGKTLGKTKNPIDKNQSMVYNGSPYVEICPVRIPPLNTVILPHNMAAVKWQFS